MFSSSLPSPHSGGPGFSGDKQPSSHWIFFFFLVQGRLARVIIKVLSMGGLAGGLVMSSEGGVCVCGGAVYQGL